VVCSRDQKTVVEHVPDGPAGDRVYLHCNGGDHHDAFEASPASMHHQGAGADNGFIFVFPDETTLGDCPDAHIMDGDAENEDEVPVVLEEDEEGCIAAAFEKNHIKMDAFHGMQACKKTTKKNHGIAECFSGSLRDAIFMADPEAMNSARDDLADKLFGEKKSRFFLDRDGAEREARRRLCCPSSKVLSNVPRTIPVPAVLEERVQRVVDACANVKDAKTGEVFFSKETWKVHQNFIKKIRAGIVSDKPGFDCCCTTTSASGKETLWCVRGTSQLEGFHKHLRSIFPGFHSSSKLSTLLLAQFVHRWNLDRAVQRGLLPEEHGGFHQQPLFLEIQELRSRSGKNLPPKFPGFQNINDHKDSEERFFTPNAVLESESAADADLSPGMEFSAARDGAVLPFTPVLRAEQTDVLALIASHSNTGSSSNQHSACNFESAAATWNKRCMGELEKPFAERRKMFPKTASHLQVFWNRHLRERNARATARQTIVVDRGNGLQETVLLSEEMLRIQQSHQAGCIAARKPVKFPAMQLAPSGDGDRVAVPPVEVAGQIQRNAQLMDVVRRGDHLVPPRVRKVSKSKRCCRCGLEKAGDCHAGGASRTATEYCTSTRSQQGWIVPAGCAVGDKRAADSQRQIKRNWKEHKASQSIEDEVVFQGW